MFNFKKLFKRICIMVMCFLWYTIVCALLGVGTDSENKSFSSQDTFVDNIGRERRDLLSKDTTMYDNVNPEKRQDALEQTLTYTDRSGKPLIAICVPTKSRSDWRTLEHTSLQDKLLPSLDRTISEQDTYDIKVYLAIDHDDIFWKKSVGMLSTKFEIDHAFYAKTPDKIPFNELAQHAFDDGAEYFVRVNDDTEFLTPNWISIGIQALSNFDPPNVGVVGPNFDEGNTAILTHDMVHRTHLLIFGTYYPQSMHSWWVDDWITKVYESRMKKLGNWKVKHHVWYHGTRYKVQWQDEKLLPIELKKGKETLKRWMQKQSMYNVISYSLYGKDKRYTEGALENVKLAQSFFPDWKVRMYYDSTVPKAIVSQLEGHVQLVRMDSTPLKNKMTWRFLVASDPNVKRYIIRDIDSRLSRRDKFAVDEWIKSGKRFHVMRDHPSHSNFAISGGMWGGTHDAVPDMESQLIKNQIGPSYLYDMNFLTTHIWPLAKKSVFQHDAFSCKKFNAQPFPTKREGYEHIGSVFIDGKMRQVDVDILKRAMRNECTKEHQRTKKTRGAMISSVSMAIMLTGSDFFPDQFISKYIEDMSDIIEELLIVVDDKPSKVAVLLENIRSAATQARMNLRVVYKSDIDLDHLVKRHLGQTANLKTAGYAPKQPMLTSYLAAIDLCRTKYCVHLDTDVFIHAPRPWVKNAVRIMLNDSRILSIGPPWSFQGFEPKYPHSPTNYGKLFDSGHGFTARAFVLNRNTYQDMLPLALPHNTHWENMVARTAPTKGLVIGELDQTHSETWALTFFGRDARKSNTVRDIEVTWARVRKNCVPKEQESVYAMKDSDFRKWIRPCDRDKLPPLSAKAFRDASNYVWLFPYEAYGEKPIESTLDAMLPILRRQPTLPVIYSQTRPDIAKDIAAWNPPFDFVLVTGASDYATSTMKVVLQNPKLHHWYGENADLDDPRVTAIPIGINYWQHKDSLEYATSMRTVRHTNTLLVNFGTTSHPSRTAVWKLFCDSPKPWVTCSRKSGHPARNKSNLWLLSPHYQLVAKHKFALCPRGNGMDTHRIYEALELGTIPIVLLGQSTALDSMYRRLPVLGVKDWSQVTEEWLNSNWKSLSGWSLRNEFQYWIQTIHSHPNQPTIHSENNTEHSWIRRKIRAVQIALPQERSSLWFKHHTALIRHFGFSVEIMNASISSEKSEDGIIIANKGSGTNGCFRSHLQAWRKAHAAQDVISVEADSEAVRSLTPDLLTKLRQYDVVAVHNYKNQPSKCAGNEIRERKDYKKYSHGTGALFFNGARSERVFKELRSAPITTGIDHWLNFQSTKGVLDIGVLCSGLFRLVPHEELGIESRRTAIDASKTVENVRYFWSGYKHDAFARWLFEERNVEYYSSLESKSSKDDVLVVGLGHGKDWKTFPGIVVAINGEKGLIQGYNDIDESKARHIVVIGAHGIVPMPYGLVEYVDLKQKNEWTRYDTARNDRQNAVVWANSHCSPHRSKIVDQIAAHVPVVALGQCTGSNQNISKKRLPLNIANGVTWHGNGKLYSRYAFVFAGENTIQDDYITEKLVMAFQSGAIPIYYGSEMAAKTFNPNSFVQWEGNATVDTIKHLLQDNQAYNNMRAQSMFGQEHTMLNYWRHQILKALVTRQTRTNRAPFLATAKVPYPVTKKVWGSKCDTANSLSLASRSKWRVALSSDTNANYLSFLPSAVDHWKSYGLEPVVALVVGANENVEVLVATIRKFAEVRVLRLGNDPSLPKGHAAKLARAYLATQFGNDVVTIVDIDFYLMWFKQWSAHLECVPENGVLGLGYNRYTGREEEGRFPMYLTTARSSTFSLFLKPHESFETWIKSFKRIKVFDDLESPYGKYGSFSDESLFRALMSRTQVPVVWINTPATWRRIDRQQVHPVKIAELKSASDVFPNRPLADCSTYKKRLYPVHRFLKINNVQRDLKFLQVLIELGLQTKDWGHSKYKKVSSLKNCALQV